MDKFLEVIQKKMYLNNNLEIHVAYPKSGSLEYTYLEKNLLEQGREPTANSTHIFRKEKHSVQASAHPLLLAQGRLLCLLTVFGLRLSVCLSLREF